MKKITTDYRGAMQRYLGGAGESALKQGYEIGRTALDAGTSLIAIAQIHHCALQAELSKDARRADRNRILSEAGQFFSECISPYEMTYGGFRDANMALRRFNEVLEQEAKRIAHALHAEAGQLLVAVYIALRQLAEAVPAAEPHIPKITQLLDQIEVQLRRLSHELTPELLNDLGLIPALRYLAEGLAQRAQLQIRIEDVAEPRLPKRVETTLYHVAKEALHNIVKHAQAKSVSIRFQRQAKSIRCYIHDDGVGFDMVAIAARKGEQGFGLLGIRERLSVVGGFVQINSAKGSGTELAISVPLEKLR